MKNSQDQTKKCAIPPGDLARPIAKWLLPVCGAHPR